MSITPVARLLLALRIYERAHLTGSFVLRSGATSSEYFDKYLFESDPGLLREIAEALVGLLPVGEGLQLRSLFAMNELADAASSDVLHADDVSLLDLVEAVRALPYGRPTDRTVEGMLRERRGTCSTKHLFLAGVLAERFPETAPQIVHRVYTLDRARAQELFGAEVAEAVPEDGLVDVHRYITVILNGRRVALDATFPGAAWDGHSSLPLACGPGADYPADGDPDAQKRTLEEQHCDPAVREPFVAVLTRTDPNVDQSG